MLRTCAAIASGVLVVRTAKYGAGGGPIAWEGRRRRRLLTVVDEHLWIGILIENAGSLVAQALTPKAARAALKGCATVILKSTL